MFHPQQHRVLKARFPSHTVLAFAAACLFAAPALAERPLLNVEEHLDIQAPADAVWKSTGRFGDLAWHPAVAKVEITQGKEGHKGAVRKVTTRDGAVIVEELLERNARSRTVRYRIVESPLPVADYVSTLKVSEAGDGASVTWSSTFRRKDEDAQQGADDAAARKIVASIYQSGLQSLKQQLEAR